MLKVVAVCGLAFGVQLDGNAIGGAVFCVQITAAAGGGFLLGAAGGVGLLYKGCSLFGRGLGGCIEHRGRAASADTGSRDSSILPVSRMLTMRLAFIGVRSFRVVFIRGSRYYKYTINWAKTKEILHEWGSKLREWLKKREN